MTGSSSGVSQLGFVPGGEGNPLDGMEWPMVRRANQTKARKLAALMGF